MSKKWALVAAAVAMPFSATALAQPSDHPIPAVKTTEYPAGIKVAQAQPYPVFVDAQGRTLYGLDLRSGIVRYSPNPAMYCKQHCGPEWEPLLATGMQPNLTPGGFGGPGGGQRPAAPPQGATGAPAAASPPQMYNAANAPDWSVIEGPNGPQWVYKGYHMVYVRTDAAPGTTSFDGAENYAWNTLKFVPPVPKLKGPNTVSTRFVDGRYVLTDAEGRALFTGACTQDCAAWKPLTGGFLIRPIGDWAVSKTSELPQWTYKGQPVFVSQDVDPLRVPSSAAILQP
jgi:predicted lipoprotein with Yx(FWY)xxD motif